jgi:ribonuclease G
VQEEQPFKPVPVAEQPKGILDTIKFAATTLVKKVQRLIRPEKKVHKEVVINAETLETRVAVLEDGRLEEFNIERTTEERLVGSIFKGKVRNLEDGLKAAFVDIGFEKNAFLHYWDIVPNQFDSGVEIVERPTAGPPARPAQDHAKGHPAALSAGQRNHRAGHQGSDQHQRPAHHDQSRAARTLSRAAAEFGPERHLAQD